MNAQCPNCQIQFAITDNMRGQNVKCGCGTVMQIPASQAVVAPAPSHIAPAPVAPSPGGTSAVAQAPIRFQCTSCGKRFKVAASSAGKNAKCGCGAKLRVPSPTQPPSSAQTVSAKPGHHSVNAAPPTVGVPPAAHGDAMIDPFAGASVPPPAPQAPTADDPLGLGNVQQYGVDLTQEQARAMAPHLQPKPKPAPKKKRTSAKKSKEEIDVKAGLTRLMGLGQIIIGFLLLITMVWLVISSIGEEYEGRRRYGSAIAAAIFGCSLIGTGFTTLFHT